MIEEAEVETEKKVRATQYVWEATWRYPDSEAKVQLVSAADLRRARVKAEKFQEEKRFDGELVSLSRREDIVL